MMKEPRLLRLIEPSIVSKTVEYNGIEYRFSKHVREIVVPSDFDMKGLNPQVFVLGVLTDADALRWYRNNKPTTKVEVKEMTEEAMVELLKEKNYIVYKKK